MNEWMNYGLEKIDAIKLDQKLDRFKQVDWRIAQSWIEGTDDSHVKKMPIESGRGGNQLRPLVCWGPFKPREELTFLLGVIKKSRGKRSGRDVSSGDLDEAACRRELLLSDKKRRVRYVRTKREAH